MWIYCVKHYVKINFNVPITYQYFMFYVHRPGHFTSLFRQKLCLIITELLKFLWICKPCERFVILSNLLIKYLIDIQISPASYINLVNPSWHGLIMRCLFVSCFYFFAIRISERVNICQEKISLNTLRWSCQTVFYTTVSQTNYSETLLAVFTSF